RGVGGNPTGQGQSARRGHGSQARREISSRCGKGRAARQPLMRRLGPCDGRMRLTHSWLRDRDPGTALSREPKAANAVTYGRENKPWLYVCKASSRSSRRRDKGAGVPPPEHLRSKEAPASPPMWKRRNLKASKA